MLDIYLSFDSVRTYAIIGPIIGMKYSSEYALFLLFDESKYKTAIAVPIKKGIADIMAHKGLDFLLLGIFGSLIESL